MTTDATKPPEKTTRAKTASLSQAVKPVKSIWKSLKINWAVPGRDKHDLTTRLPHMVPKKVTGFDAKPYISKHNYSPGADLDNLNPLPTPPPLGAVPTISTFREALTSDHFEKEVLESLKRDREKFAVASSTSTKGVQERGVAKLEAVKIQMAKNSIPIICTAIETWIQIEVDLDKEVPVGPDIHVWAFLQPRQLGGNKAHLAQDQTHVPDDYPRSGWAEYKIHPHSTAKCEQTFWKDGKAHKNHLEDRDWCCRKLKEGRRGAKVTYLFKLRVEVRNDKTADDLQRERSGKKSTRSGDIEAGCWLKVWVRDPNAGFSKDPRDDESDQVIQAMDSQSQRLQVADLDIFTRQFANPTYIQGCHGSIRSRMVIGDSDDPKDWQPVYALLFNEDAMTQAIKLNNKLKEQTPSAAAVVASTVTSTAGALILAYGLHKVKKAWAEKSIPQEVKDKHPGIKDLQADVVKAKTEYLIKLVESLEVPTLLAAYGADGFAHGGPQAVMASVTQNQQAWFQILSVFYAQIFDYSLVSSADHYKEFVEERKAGRKKILDAKSGAPPASKAEKAQAKRDAEVVKSQAGLGLLGDGAGKLSTDIGKDGFKVAINLVSGESKSNYPAPFGAPLGTTPFVWRVEVTLAGSVTVEFTLKTPANDQDDWELTAILKGDASFTVGAGIHLITSGLKAAEASALKNKDPGKDEESADWQKIEIFRMLESLMKYASLDAVVNLSFNLTAGFGFKFLFSPVTGSFSVEGVGSGKEAFHANLAATVSAHLQVSIISFDYPLAEIGKLVGVTTEFVNLDFSGNLLGLAWTPKPMGFKWAKWEFDNKILKDGSSSVIIWGKSSKYTWGYTELKSPTLNFDLTRSEGGKPILSIPSGMVSCSETSGAGTAVIEVLLTSRDAIKDGNALKDLNSKAKVGKKMDMDWWTNAESGTLLEDLIKVGNVDLYLHGSYMGTASTHSQKLTLTRPHVAQLGWTITGAKLVAKLEIQYFQDNVIWVQVLEVANKKTLKLDDQEWTLQRLTPDGGGPVGQIYRMEMTLPKAGLTKEQINLNLSLVASDVGVIFPLSP